MNHAGRTGAAVSVLVLALSVAGLAAARAEDPVPPKPAAPAPAEIVVAADGSGTHKTIAGGVGAAAEGAKVVVKAGTYLESVELKKPVTLVAAKTGGRVVLKAPEGATALAISADVTVEGLLVQGAEVDSGDSPAVRVDGGKSVFRACEITSPNGWGLIARGSTLLLDAVTVRDCKSGGLYFAAKSKVEVAGGIVRRSGKTGVRLMEESELSGSKWEIAENGGGGLYVEGKSKAEISDCRFLDGKASGILVEENASLEGTKLEIARNKTSGVEVRLLGRVLLKECNLRGSGEAGLWSHQKGQAIAQKCLFEKNGTPGIFAEDDETSVDVRDCRFMDGMDCGLYVYTGAKVLAEKCEFTGNSGSGVEVEDRGEATIHDCKMTKNKAFAVAAKRGACGKVEKCDLRGNIQGTTSRDASSKMTFTGNREK